MERIKVANMFSGNQLGHAVRDMIRSDRAQITLISEIDDMGKFLNDIGDCYVDGSNRKHDVGILVRGKKRREKARGHCLRKQVTEYIKHSNEKPMLWRDRWIVRIQIGKKVYYSVHANAAIATDNGKYRDNKGADAWKKAMRWLLVKAKEDQEAGLLVRIGGDFNQNPNPNEPLNPAWLFAELGLRWMNDRVMYLAYDPKGTRVVKKEFGPKVPGADAHKQIDLWLEAA